MVSFLRKVYLLCLVQYSFCNSPEITKESSNSVLNVAKYKSDSEHVALDKGQTSAEDNSKYDKTENESHGHKQDLVGYSEQDTKKSGHEVGAHAVGESQAYDQGQNAYEKHKSGQERKGYHRSGFVNNYHKDESGSNSSFYEDSSDENAHQGHDSRDEYYGKKAEDSYKDGRHDSAFVGHDKINKGVFGKGDRYNDQHGYIGNYNANNYDDARRNYLHDGAERYFDRNGNEIYYRQDLRRYRRPYDYPYHYYHTGYYPQDYYHNYPQDYHYNYPPRYFPPHSDHYKGDSYYPVNGGYYGNYYDDYYNRGYDNGYNNGYSSDYLPHNTHEEYIRIY